MSKIWVVYRIEYYEGEEDKTLLRAFREESKAEAYVKYREASIGGGSGFDYEGVDFEDQV